MFQPPFPPALEELGWCPFFHQQYLSLDPSVRSVLPYPERITSERRSDYVLGGGDGPRRAVLAGKLLHELPPEALPTVGDWVLAAPGELGRVEHVFERTGAFTRKAAGRTSESQCIAANVDVALVVSAFSVEEADPHGERHQLSVRRIERYLRAAAEARTRAVVVLNKADLNGAANDVAVSLRAALAGAEVVAVSAATGAGLAELTSRIARGETAVLVGSSGVGKSSLTNRLLGHDTQCVHPVRDADGRGRHTTTGRELFVLPSGGVLIDTPGMRELGLAADDDAGAAGTGFDDIDALATGCRFGDCRHEGEPGCAVLAAVETGTLDGERLASSRKLERELAFQRTRTDFRARAETKKRWKAVSRQVRQRLAEKGRR